MYSKLTRASGVLIAVHWSVSCCKRRYRIELTYECVWMYIPISDGFNLLVGNQYFPPNTDIKLTEKYFNSS
jgi:hypothetical protein